jgi:hypothetical protein
MILIGILFMWIWSVTFFVVLSKWPMGEESDRRRKYWAQYEGK